MKQSLWLLVLLCVHSLHAQDTVLTLDFCQQRAREHYPLLQQKGLLENIAALQVKNDRTAWLPQAELNAAATYQSQVTQVPISLPNVKIPQVAKDQYRATLDIKQQLYDGGATSARQELRTANREAESQKIEVELFKLKQQVTQVYFHALLWDERAKATAVMIADLRQRLDRAKAGVANGTTLTSQADLLDAEILKSEQQLAEAANGKAAAMQVMALLTGSNIPENASLQIPGNRQAQGLDVRQRPEVAMYKLQTDVLSQQSKLTGLANMPRLSAFAQGGYGRPGLNMLAADFDFYYMAGIRLNWNIWNWRYNKTEQQTIALQQQSLARQSETFVLGAQTQLLQQQAEIRNLQSALEKDERIVELRRRVKEVSGAQVDNGVLTIHDYLADLNAETQAVISRKTHEIQLIYAIINYNITKGQ
ncbi:TolC family protein [Chitinophaga sedimenti]|uniref:TolC family protein n=1 Tax=Chitinophaga sedimenti TaxID=2033606 RepID=UPI0020031A52|nr:TolC family protein [Chitinophaga sedimenti]MCK7556401.1 TolC family protein [Chitinophaga sedimenti]